MRKLYVLLMYLKVLISHKEKSSIAPVIFGQNGRPAYIASILMLTQKGRPLTSRRKVIGRIECVVPNIFPCTSVELVGARFGDSHDDTTGRPSIFRAVVVGKNSEFLQCVDRRELLACICKCVGKYGAVKHHGAGIGPASRNAECWATPRAGNSSRRGGCGDARERLHEPHSIPPIQRETVQASFVYSRPECCVRGLDIDCITNDVDGLRHFPNFHLHIHPDILANWNKHTGPSEGLESADFNGNRVVAQRE